MTSHVDHLLVDYLHEQLPEVLRSKVENHIRTCASCRAKLNRHEDLKEFVSADLLTIGMDSAQLSRQWRTINHNRVSPRRSSAFFRTGIVSVGVSFVVILSLTFGLGILSLEDRHMQATQYFPSAQSVIEPIGTQASSPSYFVSLQTTVQPRSPIRTIELLPEAVRTP